VYDDNIGNVRQSGSGGITLNITIIIPSYNARDHLYRSLTFISKQELSPETQLEVIVVNDCSTDDTEAVIEQFKHDINNLRSIYRPRDEYSNRSRARNLGILHSTGDILVFLDSGMLIPQDFVEIVADYYQSGRSGNKILCHVMYGTNIDPEQADMSAIERLTPDRLRHVCDQLLVEPDWDDVRIGLFDLVRDDIDLLSAPWTMGYSGAFTVPAALAKKVGGFDESFMGWGSEDTDFAYRLYLEGASFVAERRAFALHIPYVSASWEQKKVTNIENRQKLHRKKFRLETELYPYYPGPYYNQVIARFDQMVLFDVLPSYSYELFRQLDQDYIQGLSTTLVIGLDHLPSLASLSCTHVFAHNKSTYDKFRAHLPERVVEYLLGCDTPYSDRTFDTVVVTDMIRLLGPSIQQLMFQELHRISNRVLVIMSDYVAVVQRIDGGAWASLTDMNDNIRSLELRLTPIQQIQRHTICSLEQLEP